MARRKGISAGTVNTTQPDRAGSRVIWALLGSTLGMAAFLAAPAIRDNGHLFATFAGVAVMLIAWAIALLVSGRVRGRPLRLDVSLRPQHYVQALAHTAIFVYWGFYWDPLRHAAVLIAAQVVFAYAFDMLLAWSRRETYTLGFEPFPIIYGTNLFLRFHDDWFYLQFAMVAVGFLAREWIRWNRDGRTAPIFNAASFPLALVSIGLIVSQTSDVTWGADLASQLVVPPQIYLFIFLVSLPGQFLFRQTTMTLPAVLTTYGFSMLYLKLTGTYFFFDSNIPIAVFLGMHVLLTDPFTSPRTELGRVIFGVMYGGSVVGLYWLLGRFGAPTFYATLLQLPLLNLMVRGIDRVAQSRALSRISPERLAASLAPGMRSLGYVSLWVVVFSAMSAVGAVGDFHEGRTLPFRYQACEEGRTNGCEDFGRLLIDQCTAQSGWACNELGMLIGAGRLKGANAGELFTKACGYGSKAACANATTFEAGRKEFGHGDPSLLDFRQLLRQGRPMPEKTALQIYNRACNEGWMAGCDGLAGVYFRGGAGLAPDKPRAAALELRACEGGNARACSNLGLMHNNGDGVPKDRVKALDYLQKACDLGMSAACKWMDEESDKGGP